MADNRNSMILALGAILILALAGLWFFLAYRPEPPALKGEWACEGRDWVKKGETDEPRPHWPCPGNTPWIKGPTAPPPGN